MSEAELGTGAGQKGRGVENTDVQEEIKRTKKNRAERERRGKERRPLERISLLFKPPHGSQIWAKQELLSLGEIFSLSMDATNCLLNSFQWCSSFSMALHCSPEVPSRPAPPHQGCK